MDQRRYVYDTRTQEARLFLRDGAMFDIRSGAKLFTVEDDWAYGVKTEAPTFWIEGKNLYLYRGGSDLALHPTLYIEDAMPSSQPLDAPAEVMSLERPARSRPTAILIEKRLPSRPTLIALFLRKTKTWMEEIVSEFRWLARQVSEETANLRHWRTMLTRPARNSNRKIIWEDLDPADIPAPESTGLASTIGKAFPVAEARSVKLRR